MVFCNMSFSLNQVMTYVLITWCVFFFILYSLFSFFVVSSSVFSTPNFIVEKINFKKNYGALHPSPCDVRLHPPNQHFCSCH